MSKIKVLGGAGAIAATLGLLANAAVSQQGGLIAIDGSSTVFPITEAIAEEFMGQQSGVNVAVGVSGTGGGFSKFCAGETAISNASRPIKDTEVEACAANGIEYVELTVAYDALTVVIHPDNDWATEMTSEQLKALWEPGSTVDSWNDINSSWPNEAINLYGPGTDSGTFDYFTDEIVGEEGASRDDYTASEDDNVLVLGVARDEYALGYFGMAYYLENDDVLQAVAVDGVVPSEETIDDYALARPIFIYVNTEELQRPEVRAFVEYYLDNVPQISSEVGYVPLSDSEYETEVAELAAN